MYTCIFISGFCSRGGGGGHVYILQAQFSREGGGQKAPLEIDPVYMHDCMCVISYMYVELFWWCSYIPEFTAPDRTSSIFCKVYFAEEFHHLREMVFPSGEDKLVHSDREARGARDGMFPGSTVLVD